MKVEKAKEGRGDDDEKYVHVLVLFIGRTLGARRMKVRQTRRTYIIVVVYNMYQRLRRIYLKSP